MLVIFIFEGFKSYYLCPKKIHIRQMDFSGKICYIYVGTIKINWSLFLKGDVKIFKGVKGVKRGPWRKPATDFCALSKKSATKGEILIKFIDDYLFIGRRVRSVRSVCYGLIFWCGRSGGGRGSWRSQALYSYPKNKMAKGWPKFKTITIANYSHKFRLPFTIFNFSKSN